MKKTFRIENLCCANCARKIEEGIKKIPGVIDAKIVFMTMKLNLEVEDGMLESVLIEAKKIAKKVEPDCEITA
ncbi:MAG: cation transporter [Clostridia bacterium]|nr:cation transporter [Clostridia bacterium]